MSGQLTLGSLFDGISGFPLAGRECGIETKWLCEIEPYPRLVSSARFPDAKQYGDIHKLSGAEVEPVDCVSFGSPCQSFSIAGSRGGLDGASGLFYEAVRVIREMREATGNRYPRYAIMENVPGIYSSKSQGKSDFREVLNELLKICDKTVDVPVPEGGKFLTAGAVVGDGYSLAYRTVCASKFGVAQRRRRMFLVLSLNDERAAEILSEPDGQGRDFTPSYLKGKSFAGGASQGAGGVNAEKPVAFEPGALARIGKSAWEDEARTLRADMGDNQAAVAYSERPAYPIDMRNATRTTDGGQGLGIGNAGDSAFTVTAEYQHAVAAIENHPQDGRIKLRDDGNFPAITQRFGTGGGNTHYVLDDRKPCAAVTEDYVGAVTATQFKGPPCLFEPKAYGISSMESNAMKDAKNPTSGIYEAETARTLDGNGGSPLCRQGGTCVCYQDTVGALCSSDFKGIRNQDIGEDKAIVETFGNNGYGRWNSEPAALKASGGDYPGCMGEQLAKRATSPGGENIVVESPDSRNDSSRNDQPPGYAVRRLMPCECLLLQGFPIDHLDNIDVQDPTDEQIAYWRGAWAELGKAKSDKVIRKWLANPYSDSNAYRAIGNSLCAPCALWVFRGIVEHAEKPSILQRQQ